MRPSTAKEVAATVALALPIEEGSWLYKERTGLPGEPAEEVAPTTWMGVVPFRTVRGLSGGSVLLALAAGTGTRLPRERSTWGHLMVSGFLLSTLPFTLFAYGETRVSSALAGIGNAVTPIATLLAAMVFLPSDRPTRRKVTGVLLGLLGVVIILQPWRDLGRPDLVGFGATLLAGTSYGLGWVYNRRTIGGRDVGGLAQPTSVALPWSVRPGSAPLWPVLAVLALGVLGTGVAFAFQFDVVRAAGPTVGATVTYLIPIVAVLLGVVVLGERLSWPQVVGAGIVIGSAALTQRPSRR